MISVEIMLNAAGLAFVAAGSKWQQPDGQVMFLFILAMAALVLCLVRFRRTSLGWQPPASMRPLFTFTGRRTLEIYAVTLLVMQLLAYALTGAAPDGDSGAHDDSD